MLRYGIPDYRLPQDVLDREVNYIKRLGVAIETETSIGQERPIQRLLDDGFKAVYIACGAHKSRKMNIEGEDAQGVIHGIDYLGLLNRKQDVHTGKKVVVVGGGDVAIDAAREAVRQGAEQVSIIYRRSRAEMPAVDGEIKAAEEEGIKIEILQNPIEVLTEGNIVTAIKCIKMELGEPDDSGRRRPVPVEGSEYDISCDMVIPAIGQQVNHDFTSGTEGIELTR
ncbi:unnamed protein product, partial [Cyprideis torosa]